jgi:hypothetical protein
LLRFGTDGNIEAIQGFVLFVCRSFTTTYIPDESF